MVKGNISRIRAALLIFTPMEIYVCQQDGTSMVHLIQDFPIRGFILNSPLFWQLSFFDRWQLKTMPLIEVERYMLQKRIEIVKIHYKNA